MFRRERCRQAPAIGHAHEMHRANVQPANERGKVGRMSSGRVLLSIIGPRRRAVIAVGVGDETMLPGDRLSLGFPEAEVGDSTVHEDHRSACALFDVGQIDAVHTQVTRLERSLGFGD